MKKWSQKNPFSICKWSLYTLHHCDEIMPCKTRSSCHTYAPDWDYCDETLTCKFFFSVLSHNLNKLTFSHTISVWRLSYDSIIKPPQIQLVQCLCVSRKKEPETKGGSEKQEKNTICAVTHKHTHAIIKRFRLIKDGHLPQQRGKETWDFQRICTGFVAPRGQRLGERQRRTAWWARHSKDTANDHLVQTCLY